jgi:hypothetical protein
MATWASVKLKGKSQVIPPICPNCMAPATVSYRYGYKGLKGWLTRTTYYQTFNYCDPCHKQADSAQGLMGWALGLSILGVAAFVVFLVLLVDFTAPYRDPETHKASDLTAVLVMIAAILAAAVLCGGLWWLVRAVKRKRHPMSAGQAVWGPAAYYTGSGVLDVQSYSSYKAARREWLAELIKANPAQVDDDTYVSYVGASKPETGAARPFGGG